MINGKTITLVIPCKNEANSLARLLPKVPSFIDEVLVIDNNSSDTTREVAAKLGARVIKELRKDSKNIGYGYAHQAGIKAATGQIIVTMDGDGTYPLNQIKKVVLYFIKHEFDFISCSRFPLLRKEAVSWIRKLGVKILNSEVNMLYNYPITDILSGMWVVSKSAAKKIKPSEGGWNLSPEIKLKALLHPEIAFTEYHIDHHYRENGASKQQIWVTGFDHLFFIGIFRLNILKNDLVALFSKVFATKKPGNRYIPISTAPSLD